MGRLERIASTGAAIAVAAVALPSVAMPAAAPSASTPPTGHAAEEPPAEQPRPEIAIAPRTVTYGEPAEVTGTLLGGAASAGLPVALLERAVPGDGMYHELARAPADPAGAFAFAIRPGANAYYAVRTRAEPVQTSLGLLVRVAPAVTLTAPAAAQARGRRLAFTGTVRPPLAGTPVRLQRRKGDSWTTVERGTLQRADATSSTFSFAVRVRRTGTYRAVVEETAGLSQATTLPHRIRIRR